MALVSTMVAVMTQIFHINTQSILMCICQKIVMRFCHSKEKSKKVPKGARSLLCFNSLRGIMSVDGGNDYKQAHNNSRNLIKTTGTPIDLRVDLEDYDMIDALTY